MILVGRISSFYWDANHKIEKLSEKKCIFHPSLLYSSRERYDGVKIFIPLNESIKHFYAEKFRIIFQTMIKVLCDWFLKANLFFLLQQFFSVLPLTLAKFEYRELRHAYSYAWTLVETSMERYVFSFAFLNKKKKTFNVWGQGS